MGDPFPLTGGDSARSPLISPPLPEAVREQIERLRIFANDRHVQR